MKTELFIGVVALLLLNGCGIVSSSLSAEKQEVLKGKTVTIVKKDTLIKPGQKGKTSTDMGINMYWAVTRGIENRQTHGPVYGNPTQEISRKTMTLLSKKFGMIEVRNSGQKNFKSNYSLEVKTNWWIENMLGSAGYLMMANDIRLIELNNNKIIAHSVCMYGDNTEERIAQTSVKEIFAHDGEIIKREARKAVDSCMKKIDTQIFARPDEARPIKDPDFMNRPLI